MHCARLKPSTRANECARVRMRPVPSEPPTTRVRPRGVLINCNVAKSSTDPVKEGATETKRNGGRCYPAFSFLLSSRCFSTRCIVARSPCRSRGIPLSIPTLLARGDAPLSIFHYLIDLWIQPSRCEKMRSQGSPTKDPEVQSER